MRRPSILTRGNHSIVQNLINKSKKPSKEPWEELPEVWPTQSAYFKWLRGQMRKAWARHPIKHAYMLKHRVRAPLGRKTIPNPTGMVWCAPCEQCGATLRESDCQVDHIIPAGSFKSWDDFTAWMIRLMHINFDSVRSVCKPCHKIITHAELKGMSFEEAKLDKEVIAFKNLTANQQKRILSSTGLIFKYATNAKQRTAVYRQHLLNERKL